MKDYWKNKLTAFDTDLCRMVASLTEMPCEPKYGGDSYFIEADYSKHPQPEYILAIWDAIEGRAGARLLEMKDDAERRCIVAYIRFQDKNDENLIFHERLIKEQ